MKKNKLLREILKFFFSVELITIEGLYKKQVVRADLLLLRMV